MNQKSQQLCLNKKLVLGYDKRLTKTETKRLLFKLFPNNIEIVKIAGHNVFVVDKNKILLCAQLTYLGNPHPIYKKRIQLKKWFLDVYKETRRKNINTFFIGIYRYGKNVIFCDFDKALYVQNKMHNSSAHVYINDLYQAMQYGYFSKTDKNSNEIFIFTPKPFVKHIRGVAKKDASYEGLFKLIERFNNSFMRGKQIWAIKAIKEMYKGRFRHWKQGEWPAFFLEYKFDKFINEQKASNLICYLNKEKKEKNLDFDLKFNKHNFYGDLKSSSIEELEPILNDCVNVNYELSKYGKLWFLIYKHTTKKDSSLSGYPMTKARNVFIKRIDPKYSKDAMSYHKRMKASVKYVNMFIIEINRINISSLLSKMTSNFHQPDKITKRNPKFQLNKDNIENAIIYRYSL